MSFFFIWQAKITNFPSSMNKRRMDKFFIDNKLSSHISNHINEIDSFDFDFQLGCCDDFIFFKDIIATTYQWRVI